LRGDSSISYATPLVRGVTVRQYKMYNTRFIWIYM